MWKNKRCSKPPTSLKNNLKNSLKTTCLAQIPIHGKTKQIVGWFAQSIFGNYCTPWLFISICYIGQNIGHMLAICWPFTQVSILAHVVIFSQENVFFLMNIKSPFRENDVIMIINYPLWNFREVSQGTRKLDGLLKIQHQWYYRSSSVNSLVECWETLIVAPTGSPFYVGNMDNPNARFTAPFTTG